MDQSSEMGQEEIDTKDLDQFWSEVDDILDLSENEIAQGFIVHPDLIYTKLNAFVTRCIDYYESHLQQAATGEDATAKLVESSLYTHSAILDIANALIKLVVAATSLPTLHLLFQSILLVGKDQPEMYRSTMVATQLIPRLVHHIWAARYAEEYLVKDLAGGLESGEGNGQEGGWSLDWNIKYVRAKSMGDPDKEIQEARNRILQCRLREESVVLLYQVCRAQRLELKDMRAIDGAFIDHLFELVEASRHWNDDSYNYRLIKLIVALNEQFMVASIEQTSQKSKTHSRKSSASSSNVVMSVLRFRLHASNTFGENLIWMLNRASNLDAEDICMQSLVLKLLYLLFTTEETAHYFYLNDLKVLVDVFIRELSDLPEESESLRNTYLRVLHPLLTNTQLLTYPYKRDNIRSLLQRLISHANLRDISSTTKRLVDRCLNAQWCVDLDGSQSFGKQTLEIQTVAGGPSEMVQSQIVTDAEGVIIPVNSDHQRFFGAPSTTASTIAVAGATFVPSNANGSKEASAVERDDAAIHTRVRGSSVGAKSPRRDHSELPNGNAEVGLGHRHLESQRREASSSSANTLSVRRDLGQRSLSARAAPLSPPLPGHIVSTSRYLQRSNSQDVDTDDENTSRWSDGSASNSWHLAMADGELSTSLSLSNPKREAMERQGSPLTQDSTEHYSNLAVAPYEETSKSIPVLQIEALPNEESINSSSMSSNTGNLGHGRRRRPPAPPSLNGGFAASRREKRGQLSSSTSEMNLPASLARSIAVESSLSKEITASLPNSPRAESFTSTGNDSPVMVDSCPYIPPSQNSCAYIPPSRRKPPPPPINRATKGSRTPNQQPLPTRARLASNASSNSITPREAQDKTQSHYTDEQTTNARHVEKAMDYLYVADDSYGWG